MKISLFGSKNYTNYPLFYEIMNKIIKKTNASNIEFFAQKDKFSNGAEEWAGINNLLKTYAEYTYYAVKFWEISWFDLTHPNSKIKESAEGRKYDSNAPDHRNQKMIQESDFVVLIFYSNDTQLSYYKNLCIKNKKPYFEFKFPFN